MPDPGHRGPPWAGDGGRPGWGPGRHVFRRILGFVFFLFLVAVVIGAVVTRLAAIRAGNRWVLTGVVIVALFFGLGFLARSFFGRTWAPVGNLIDATRRLGEGETGVRIEEWAPGPFGAIGASFNRMAARLEEEDERRRRLLADLGHELRTPLTVIRGEIEAVLDGLHPPESLSHVVDEVDLMERLLEDLRVLALAEAGRLQLHKEPVEVEGLIGEVVASFSTALEAKRVQTRLKVEPDLDELDADPHRLHQILANLVSNVVHHLPDGGALTISAYQEAGWVVIEVADDGPGIPADRLDQIFERFAKASDSTGTGLGLSIVRDLVQAHDGTIIAANRSRGGAIFTIRLPVQG